MAASICARRHSNCHVNTVSVEELHFKAPLQIGHVAKIAASVSRTFNTSLEVIVDVFDEDTISEKLFLAATGIFIFVALDENHNATQVPHITPESDEEKKQWHAAGKRRERRKKEF